MKSISLLVAAAVAATFVTAQEDSCTPSTPEVHVRYIHASDAGKPAQVDDTPPSAPQDNNHGKIFGPVVLPSTDRDDPRNVRPVRDISLQYAPENVDVETVNVNVTHAMMYPTVVLEFISSISNVDCSADSVTVTFSDASVYDLTQESWSLQDEFIMVTNHLGDCDVEFERGIFLASDLIWDDEKLVVVASAEHTDVASTATETIITFGNLTSHDLAKRTGKWNDDNSYTISNTYALPNNYELFSSPPYINVVANNASLTTGLTFSGHLKYNWLAVRLETLAFDIDTTIDANLGLTVQSAAAYNQTFSYAPEPLYYGISIPGILELGPQLLFEVEALVAASEKVNLSTALGLSIADGNIHLDFLNATKTGASGWTPSYTADVHVDASVVADINPAATLTLEVACKLFGGIIDLSTGIIARPSFKNHLELQADVVVGAEGAVSNNDGSSSCPNGLLLQSQFDFAIDAFATQWWEQTVYSVTQPIVDKCYSWA